MNTSISTIDIAIVIGYLFITLVIGIRAGMGKNVNKTMKDYALGTEASQPSPSPQLSLLLGSRVMSSWDQPQKYMIKAGSLV